MRKAPRAPHASWMMPAIPDDASEEDDFIHPETRVDPRKSPRGKGKKISKKPKSPRPTKRLPETPKLDSTDINDQLGDEEEESLEKPEVETKRLPDTPDQASAEAELDEDSLGLIAEKPAEEEHVADSEVVQDTAGWMEDHLDSDLFEMWKLQAAASSLNESAPVDEANPNAPAEEEDVPSSAKLKKKTAISRLGTLSKGSRVSIPPEEWTEDSSANPETEDDEGESDSSEDNAAVVSRQDWTMTLKRYRTTMTPQAGTVFSSAVIAVKDAKQVPPLEDALLKAFVGIVDETERIDVAHQQLGMKQGRVSSNVESLRLEVSQLKAAVAQLTSILVPAINELKKKNSRMGDSQQKIGFTPSTPSSVRMGRKRTGTPTKNREMFAKSRHITLERFVEDELEYVHKLSLLCGLIVMPLQDEGKGDLKLAKLKPADVSKVFQNIVDIWSFHMDFLESLRRLKASFTHTTRVSDLLKKFVAGLRLYRPYILGYGNSLQYLEDLRKRKDSAKFNKFLREQEKHKDLQGQGLLGLLGLPLLRPRCYLPLVQKLVDVTPSLHEDSTPLREVLESLTQLLNSLP